MKKLLLSIALLSGLSVNAQIPDYGVWPAGVTMTDLDGNTYDLDAILSSGKSIVIDAYATWCGPCWNYHSQHILEGLWQAKGTPGDGSIMLFGVETDASTTAAQITTPGSGDQGNWRTGINYPMVNDDNLGDIINQAYYPTLILICPDRTVTEVGQKTQAQWITKIGQCASEPTTTNDPRVLGTNVNGGFLCGGATTASVELKIAVQNYSPNAINSTYTINVMNGATQIATTNAPLNLDGFEWTELNLGTVNLPAGATNLSAVITTPNDVLTNDTKNFTVTNTVAEQLSVTGGNVALDVKFDGYGSEFGYIWNTGVPYTSNLVTIHNDAAGGITTPIKFGQVGSITNATPTLSTTLNTPSEGCYYLVVVDAYGDGLTYTSTSYIHLTDAVSTHNIDVDYDGGFAKVYDVAFTAAGLDDLVSVSDLKLYPNPSTTSSTVSVTMKQEANLKIQVINAVGQVISTTNLGSVSGIQNVEINTSEFAAGTYTVIVDVDGQKTNKILSVMK